MKAITFVLLWILMIGVASAQTRINLQSGITALTEKGYHSSLSTTTGISWGFDNGFSWGIQYSFMQPRSYKGSGNHLYCDQPLVGWGNKCPEGHDSLVFSDHTTTYKHTAVCTQLMFRLASSERTAFSLGFNLGLNFLSRNYEIHNSLFKPESAQKVVAGNISCKSRFSYFPFASKSQGEIFIEPKLGALISPWISCTDGGCNKIIKRALNGMASIEIGIALDLN